MNKSECRRLKRLNQQQYLAALEAAEWIIREDRRLLGLPKVRWPMIQAAALETVGASAPLEESVYGDLHDDSVNVVLEVYRRAVTGAQQAITPLPPLRFSSEVSA